MPDKKSILLLDVNYLNQCCLIPKGCIDFQQFTSFRTEAINCGKSRM